MSISRIILAVFTVLLSIGIVLVIKENSLSYSIEQEQSNEITQHYKKKLLVQLGLDAKNKAGSIIFIGDSITEHFDVKTVSSNALNFGISMDTTIGTIKRISKYSSLNSAFAIIILIGVNDINRYGRSAEQITKNHKKILSLLPSDILVFICDVLPVDERVKFDGYNKIIQKINSGISTVSAEYDNVIYVPMFKLFSGSDSNLMTKYHVGDGIHLNKNGYKIFKTTLTDALLASGVSIIR